MVCNWEWGQKPGHQTRNINANINHAKCVNLIESPTNTAVDRVCIIITIVAKRMKFCYFPPSTTFELHTECHVGGNLWFRYCQKTFLVRRQLLGGL